MDRKSKKKKSMQRGLKKYMKNSVKKMKDDLAGHHWRKRTSGMCSKTKNK